jgi:5-methylcytosine-specific restriction protein A
LDKSLKSLNQDEKDEAESLIKKGRCFVQYKYKDNEEIKFAPSKFIGYKENTIKNHIEARGVPGSIHGTQTNKVINSILLGEPEVNDDSNKKYKDYCYELGFIPNENGPFGVKRKYWKSIIEIDKK